MRNGGQAFPSTEYSDERPVGNEPGMSLRDWFAGQALAGLVNGAASAEFSMAGLMSSAEETHRAIHEVVAVGAYLFADAMLSARSKGGAS